MLFSLNKVPTKNSLFAFRKELEMTDFTEKDLGFFFTERVLPRLRLQIRDKLKSMFADSGMVDGEEVRMLCMACCRTAGEEMCAHLQEKGLPISMFFQKRTSYLFFMSILHEVNSELPKDHNFVLALFEDEEGTLAVLGLKREAIQNAVKAGAKYERGMVPMMRVLPGAEKTDLKFEMPALP